MPLGIPTDRAFRSRHELCALIRAIRDAPSSEMEQPWIEWKAAEKLLASSCLGEIARHVIGFANRSPEEAARIAEGCAYLLIGAEPGHLASVEVIDIAQLDQGLELYLGTDGPQWGPDYVEVDGNTVLVVTVEAPRRGDRIHTLRKEYQQGDEDKSKEKPKKKSCPAGTVFVRKNGRTVHPPDPATMNMLQDRLLDRNVQVELDVSWSPGSATAIVALDAGPDTLYRWLDRERRRLLAPVEAEEDLRDKNRWVEQFIPGIAGIRTGSILGTGDRRSPEEYRDEVDKYLVQAEIQLPARARALAVEQVAPTLEVWVTNGTDHNFQDVQVEIIFMGPVAGYVDQREIWKDVDFPTAPNIYGTETSFESMINYVGLRRPSESALDRGWANNTPGRCRIQFQPINLRPRYSVRLPSFRLLAEPEAAGTTLTGVWYATSTSADGVKEGQLSVLVDPTVVSAGAVLSNGEDHVS